ncbi:hypothetical protein SSX86_004809 [Deinandra increscens subsp. villosa]|uniref:Cytochrome P450 76AD1-like protein n=1 Tax=Deinandra increscens subsp. villosa TaxID=3103831 RepID=A0AAP0DNN5_9ASTR
MDHVTFLILLLPFLLTIIYVLTNISGHGTPRLPPGPFPLPVFGNLLKLSHKPHRSLAALSKRYGPLMSLKLGSRTTIVVSSPNVAQQFFNKHDQSFSSRSLADTTRIMNHHEYSIAWLPAGDQWRKLRRITKECLFSAQSLDHSQQLRRKKVQELVDHVSRCCKNEQALNVGALTFTTILNMLSNMIFSVDVSHYDSTSSQEFKDVIWGVMEIGGKPNLVDFFPVLKPLDPQGLVSEGLVYGKKLYDIFDKLIDQRRETRARWLSYGNDSCTQNDVLDSLLDINFKDKSEFSITDMKHLFLDLFIAGTDTTSTTLEWAMTELICNPKKMEIARLEVIKCMRHDDTIIEEHDISRLPYLQVVIKETLRLHPPAPFLIPHEAIHDVEVEGFVVPKDAQILCNVWAIGRDPKVWSNPDAFIPERFLKAEIDYKGHDFKLIPFGAGRRICPGLNLAHRMLHVVLGSLIAKFDWKLEGNMKAQELDMEEKFGLTLPRKTPLMAIPFKP